MQTNPQISALHVLQLVSAMWPLSDWLEETVGGVHLFVDLPAHWRSTNVWGIYMHKNWFTKVCSDLQMHGKFKCSQINVRQSCVC